MCKSGIFVLSRLHIMYICPIFSPSSIHKRGANVYPNIVQAMHIMYYSGVQWLIHGFYLVDG